MALTHQGFEYLNLENIPTKAFPRDVSPKDRPKVGQTEICDVPFEDAFRAPVHGASFTYKDKIIHLYERKGQVFAYSASQKLPSELLEVSFVISSVTPVLITYFLFGAGHVGFAVKDAPNISTIKIKSAPIVQKYDCNNHECSTKIVEFKVKNFELDDGCKVNIATVDDCSPTNFEVSEALRLHHL